MRRYWGIQALRELNQFEVENVSFLTRYNLDFGLLEPTATGLRKSILDATAEYRMFLRRNAIHDYGSQHQGPDHKLYIRGHALMPDGDVRVSTASVYRPCTKLGDPRIWFSGLRRYCDPNDILVSLWADDSLWILNASKVDFAWAADAMPAYRRLLVPLIAGRESVFDELLGMLRDLSARGPIPTYKTADTGAGHLLETELGIKQNSSRNPDYKGVELKSSRAPGLARSNLFAKVADWRLSQVAGAQEMLDKFGYFRDGEKKLNCTISGAAWNPQGLKFEVDEKADLLHVISRRADTPRPETWRLETLRDTLASKHADTFWVKADSYFEGDVEFVHFVSVVQTSQPIVQQFSPMLSAGTITMDHMLTNRGDRGPEFKVHKRNINELFPRSIYHDLTATDYIGGTLL